jgi:hypothetical protein
MKHRILIAALASYLLTNPLPTFAAPPLINYQGRIVVGTTNFEGTGQFKFALVDGGVNQNVQATAFIPGTIGSITFIFVANGGSGYVAAPEVTITDATGTGATAVAIVTGGAVTSIQVTNGGTGYSPMPTVTIAPPPPNIFYVSFWKNDGSGIGAATEPAAAVALPVAKGLYSVLLGDTSLPNMTALPNLSNVPDVRLRVWFNDGVNGFQLLSPDQRLAPAAYLADGTVTSATIADAAITSAKVAAGAITGTQLASGTIDATRLATPGNPSAGQVLGYNAGSLAWIAGGGGTFALNGTNAFYNGGNVGIGTDIPATKLEVRTGPGSYGLMHSDGTIKVASYLGSSASGATGGWFGTQSPHPLHFFVNGGQPKMTINHLTGYVGIGDTSPSAPLDIAGEWYPNAIANALLTGGNPTLQWSASSGFPLFNTRSWIAHVGSSRGLEFWTRLQNTTTDSGWLSQVTLTTDGDIEYLGKLGKLDTAEQFNSTVRVADFYLGHSTRRGTPGRALVDWKDPVTNQKRLVINWANDWEETHIEGLVTQVRTLRITGGADLAEPFQMKEEELEKGSVVVIDDEHPGRLKRSSGAYDTRVAGIISGANGVNPGIALHQEGVMEGGQNVALSGRVYVRADATGAPIRPGDLLTTSDTPGHAMKVKEHTRAQGAVIGKAMSSLDEGTGMVLVLVTLQ